MLKGCGRECEGGCMLVVIDVLSLSTQGLTCCLIDWAAPRFLCLLNQGPACGPPQPNGRDMSFCL
jgi:hypothetical protein